jgi:hypothetical protein
LADWAEGGEDLEFEKQAGSCQQRRFGIIRKYAFKMRNYLYLLLLFMLLQNSVHAQKDKIKVLKETYQKGFITKGNDSITYQKRFFNAFPSDFKSFTR